VDDGDGCPERGADAPGSQSRHDESTAPARAAATSCRLPHFNPEHPTQVTLGKTDGLVARILS
jgi:hypothetical protein